MLSQNEGWIPRCTVRQIESLNKTPTNSAFLATPIRTCSNKGQPVRGGSPNGHAQMARMPALRNETHLLSIPMRCCAGNAPPTVRVAVWWRQMSQSGGWCRYKYPCLCTFSKSKETLLQAQFFGDAYHISMNLLKTMSQYNPSGEVKKRPRNNPLCLFCILQQ
jgi:hypothetical protein